MKTMIPKYVYVLKAKNKQYVFTSRDALRAKIKQFKEINPNIKLTVKRSKTDPPELLTATHW